MISYRVYANNGTRPSYKFESFWEVEGLDLFPPSFVSSHLKSLYWRHCRSCIVQLDRTYEYMESFWWDSRKWWCTLKRRKPSHVQSIGLVRTNLLCKIGRGIDENVSISFLHWLNKLYRHWCKISQSSFANPLPSFALFACLIKFSHLYYHFNHLLTRWKLSFDMLCSTICWYVAKRDAKDLS